MGRWGLRWTPPPNWPEPPEGFVPGPGWRPDLRWGPVPPDHRWWQRTRRGRGLMAAAIAGAVLFVAGVGSCTVLAATHGPCWFDPPPGDVGDIDVVNDTGADVTMFDCETSACAGRFDTTRVVRPGGTIGYQYEMCSGLWVGLADDGGTLVGCLRMPVGEPAPVPRLRMSDAGDCDGHAVGHRTDTGSSTSPVEAVPGVLLRQRVPGPVTGDRGQAESTRSAC
jgi:hypothetical protein